MRRSLAALAVVVAGLAVAPTAQAGESVPSGTWQGSSVNRPAPITSDSPQTDGMAPFQIGGTLRRGNGLFFGAPGVVVDVRPPAPGCPVPPAQAAWVGDPALRNGVWVRDFISGLSFDTAGCNGPHPVGIKIDGTELMDTVLVVSLPAPAVTGVTAVADDDGRSVAVEWDDMRPAAHDLSGYQVERRIGDGTFARVASLSAGATSFTDADLPDEAGEATYRVSSTRPTGDGDQTVSAARSSDATPFQAAPADPGGTDGTGGGSTDGTGTGTGTGTGDSGSGGAAGGDAPGGAPGAAGGGTGGSSKGARPSGRVAAPRLGITGTFLPPLLQPKVPTVAGATSAAEDDGFDEELPYLPGSEDDPTVGDSEQASVLLGEGAGRGMAIPIATALVLAVWALHLRVLARAARPQ